MFEKLSKSARLIGLAVACQAAALAFVLPARAGFIGIELTPTDVSSLSTSVFSTLPTIDPSVFGFSGDVRAVNFDTTPGGTPIAPFSVLTNEYASLGVVMSNILVRDGVFEGAASPPNTTFDGLQLFTFTVPVAAVGIVNTSPDQDLIEALDENGNVVFSFRDQEGLPKNFHVDRFVGVRATGNDRIAAIRFGNNTGNIELDEMIFEVRPRSGGGVPEPSALALLLAGLAGLAACRRRI